MPFTTYTLSGDVSNIIGADYDPATVRLVLEATDAILSDGVSKVRFGDVQASIAADGTFSITGIPASVNSSPAYRVVITWQDAGSRRQRQQATGWFAMTANSDLALKVTETITPQPVQPSVDTVTASYVNDDGSATSAALRAKFVEQNSQVWDIRDHNVPTDGVALADTALGTLLGAMAPGDTLRIPPGAVLKLAARRDLSKRITIDGNGATITQSSTTGAFRLIDGSDGSKIRNLRGVGPSGTVQADASIFILTAGTVADYLTDITLEDVRGEAWGRGTFEAHWTRGIKTRDVHTQNCFYIGQQFLSCEDITLVNPTCDTLAGITAGDCYPIAFTRDSSLSLAAAPRTRNATVHGGWARNTPWEALDGHGAQGVKVFGYHSRNTEMGVAFTRSTNEAGVATYAALDCWAFGCTAESGVSDGSKREGFMLVGAGTTEKATGGFVGCTSIGHGDQANANSGGFYLSDTDQAQIHGCRDVEGSVNSLLLSQGNLAAMVHGFTSVDPWSTASGAVASLKLEGAGQSITLNGFRILARSKTATNLRSTGIRAASDDTTSRIYWGAGNDLSAAAAKYANAATEAMLRQAFFGATEVARPAALTATAAAAPAGGTGTAAGGWDTAANRDAAIATINNLKTRVDELETKFRALGLLT